MHLRFLNKLQGLMKKKYCLRVIVERWRLQMKESQWSDIKFYYRYVFLSMFVTQFMKKHVSSVISSDVWGLKVSRSAFIHAYVFIYKFWAVEMNANGWSVVWRKIKKICMCLKVRFSLADECKSVMFLQV